MFNWPNFDKCGCGTPSEDIPCVSVPCPTTGLVDDALVTPSDLPDSQDLACNSNFGKFYDRFIDNFVTPGVGETGFAKVCNPSLWIGCQWISVCRPGNPNAIFKVADAQPEFQRLLLVNACSDGEAIDGNPNPGDVFFGGAVFYPVAPPWCSQYLQDKVISIIESGDSNVSDSILQVLTNSDEICFRETPDLESGREAHLFGGDYDASPYQSDPSLLNSCLRKLRKIYTRFLGRTICFQDIPSTSDDPEDGVAKRFVYLDKNNCLRRGGEVNANVCGDALIKESLSSIAGCNSGARALLVPTDKNKIIKSFKDPYNNAYWAEASAGLTYYPLPNPVDSSIVTRNVSGSSSSTIHIVNFGILDVNMPDVDFPPNARAAITVNIRMNLNGYVSGECDVNCGGVVCNNILMTNNGLEDRPMFCKNMNTAIVPVVDINLPKRFTFSVFTGSAGGGTSYDVIVRATILGYYA